MKELCYILWIFFTDLQLWYTLKWNWIIRLTHYITYIVKLLLTIHYCEKLRSQVWNTRVLWFCPHKCESSRPFGLVRNYFSTFWFNSVRFFSWTPLPKMYAHFSPCYFLLCLQPSKEKKIIISRFTFLVLNYIEK